MANAQRFVPVGASTVVQDADMRARWSSANFPRGKETTGSFPIYSVVTTPLYQVPTAMS
ncbi:uncharacterized protein BBA_03948 [Beauveria bassiana ARSEF 2860]|uniref:Uncharacterized protein n=1 Tax=Beauveria bassiana (strain ARSEF 2860) TaxID=655819 RepID=J4KPF7_BEAB2|nr:uncharacterized protein BBA_03948 [Beauveria bassiana ARSEF 2860]EJP67374.1 hypothetical protein BBA_03948 [Beauveria bassiana ARSEF 2860]